MENYRKLFFNYHQIPFLSVLLENLTQQEYHFIILLSRIAITKLDILDVFEEVKIGVAYWIDDKKVEDSFPGKPKQWPYQRGFATHLKKG